MSGILFLKTQKLSEVVTFYSEQLDAELWMDQGDCKILRHGNFLFGFCERDRVEADVMLTFFYESRDEVDRMYDRLKDSAVDRPKQNDKYNIYQFFARDPEGRMVEIQYFGDPVSQHESGGELLLSRRSVRDFKPDDVPDDLLTKVIELSRWAPTARNTQPYYFVMIRGRKLISWLSEVRGSNSAPIGRAPVAVAVCSDPSVSTRHVQDGCIAAYHFMLAAHFYGLGTCWIAAMDSNDVKKRLEVPAEHYVVTVTPLGFPAKRMIEAPARKTAEAFVRGL